MLEKIKSKLSNSRKSFIFKIIRTVAKISVGFFLLLLSQTSNAATQSLTALTLADVLDATLSKQQSTTVENTFFNKRENETSWLASSPKLGLNYLKSDQDQGTDEFEVSLNLPFKSSLQAQIDNDLIKSNKALKLLSSINQQLYFSGQIRTQLWQIKIAQSQASNIEKKLSFLARLEKQYSQLVNSNQSTKYPLLLIQQEILDAKIIRLDHHEKLNALMAQYYALTGLRFLPQDIIEKTFTTDTVSMTNHPQIKTLDQTWFEFERNLQLSSNKSAPWNLSLSAKQLDNNIFNETQIGIGVEVPITFLAVEKQALSNEWQREKSSYDSARSAQLITLQKKFQWLLSQQKALNQKQNLLEQSKALSKAIIRETQLLIDANQIDQSQALRRMLNAFNTKSQLQLNQLFLLKNIAMLRQSAGISL
ncbi:MAG: hypothetical protein RPR97_01735 [Colwellia sp.]